jgi:hypothetical protein
VRKKTGEGENNSDAAAAFAENEKCTKNNAPKEKGRQEASHTDSQERRMSTARNFANEKVLQRALFLTFEISDLTARN